MVLRKVEERPCVARPWVVGTLGGLVISPEVGGVCIDRSTGDVQTAGTVREEAARCEEEERKRAARGARFAAAPAREAADERTTAKRCAWPGGTMTVVMPGQPPRKIVKQGNVRGTAVDGSDEGGVKSIRLKRIITDHNNKRQGCQATQSRSPKV